MNYTQDERKERVYKFFIKTPDKPDYNRYKIIIAVCVILIVVGYSQGGSLGITMIIGLVGLFMTLKKFYAISKQYSIEFKIAEPKATDIEMDQWLKDGHNIALNEARKRLDIDIDDESADPLMIDGPAANALIGPGKDRILRFSSHDILLIFLTDHNIATFKCTFDLSIGEILQDSTKEFPYKDITNLETNTTPDTFYYKGSEKKGVKGVQKLSLYTSGVNNISVNYFFSKEISEDYIVPASDAENTIKAVRKRLKEYKDKYSNSTLQ